jgi:phenylpropionate dioxygenase-like ring-hydroxylating dioxygenase large terminal subunit
MSTLKNVWYFAAFDYEVNTERLLARRFAGVPVVLWRLTDGGVAALQDACPHRFVPLSRGRLAGDEVECAYHGFRFDQRGRCSAVPSQDSIPRSARARTYPVVERHGAVWIWVGDPALADPASIPDYFYQKHPDWVEMGHGMLVIKANCQLVVDNLLDLSHIAFVHRRTVGNASSVVADVSTKIKGDSVSVDTWIWDQPPVPLWQKAFDNYPHHVDHWLNMRWQPPGFFFMDVGVKPVGASREDGIFSLTSHILTPGDERTTYYFWCSTRQPTFGDRVIDRNFSSAVDFTFHEDAAIIEEQQQRLDEFGIKDMSEDYHFPLSVNSDKGALQARKIMQRLLADEASRAKFAH